jgi:hypothetical protein
MLKRFLVAALLLASGPAFAQQSLGLATAVATCGGQSLTAGLIYPVTQDLTGTFCSTAGGGGGSTTVLIPSTSSSAGLTPVVSSAAEASHVLKASAGNAYAAYATNLTATNGFLVLLNATSAPADGAIAPLACAPLSANGVASINYAPGPPGVFSTGITAVVTSAVTCFTKTTGVITAFISGAVK